MAVDLDYFLHRRKTPDVPAGLEARIIALAARYTPDHETVPQTLYAALRQIFRQGLMIPEPAMAFAVVLFFSTIFGAQIDLSEGMRSTMTTEDLAAFMIVEDSPESGEGL